MAIRTEYQVVISCDSCWRNWVEAYFTQKRGIAHARKEGWKIGKRVTCPACQRISEHVREKYLEK
jgi:hypothetical protein